MQYHVLQTNAVVTKCLLVTKGYRYLNEPTAKTCMFAEVWPFVTHEALKG